MDKPFTEREEELLEALYIRNFEEDRYDSEGLDELLPDLPRLEAEGAVEQREGEIRLTAAGLSAGARVVRLHRLTERLLADVFGETGDLMHERACRFEHVIDRGLDESICTLLGHPTVCPHGKPIPAGACCERGSTEVKTIVTTLARMSAGERGTIAYLHSEDTGVLNKLMALGVVPGSKVELLQHRPSYAFRAGESQFAVDGEIAGSIFVRLSPEGYRPEKRRRHRHRGRLSPRQA